MRHPINRRHLRPRVRRRNGNHGCRDAITALLSHTPAERLRYPYAASPAQADQRINLVFAGNRQGLGHLEIGYVRLHLFVSSYQPTSQYVLNCRDGSISPQRAARTQHQTLPVEAFNGLAQIGYRAGSEYNFLGIARVAELIRHVFRLSFIFKKMPMIRVSTRIVMPRAAQEITTRCVASAWL